MTFNPNTTFIYPYGIQQNDKLKIILCYHFKTKQTINIQINF